jgi:TPP-dependent pyruvate/acetoin dehydrogenase alpha subunit
MTPDIAKQLLFQMRRIRRVEEEIARRYGEGKMRCPTHLSIGQEAVAAAVGLSLQRTDLVVSGHRAHAHSQALARVVIGRVHKHRARFELDLSQRIVDSS